MSKKHDINYVRKQFEEEGYVLLTIKYINCEQKLEYICPKGHKHSISWNAWRNQGQRCPFCAGLAKLKIEFIVSEFEKEDYILLTTKYINSKQKLEYICSNGHRHSITWNNWKTGWRCPVCFHTRLSGPNHPNWKGGITYEPYCDAWADKEYKESIKERDDYECQNLYCFKKKGNASQLTIHHINYNKKNCCPENLITLCRSCNSRANKDREWHTVYYREIMRRRNLLDEQI